MSSLISWQAPNTHLNLTAKVADNDYHDDGNDDCRNMIMIYIMLSKQNV